MNPWITIPADITSVFDREKLVSILSEYGLEVRQKSVKDGAKNAKRQRYIEYRERGAEDDET